VVGAGGGFAAGGAAAGGGDGGGGDGDAPDARAVAIAGEPPDVLRPAAPAPAGL